MLSYKWHSQPTGLHATRDPPPPPSIFGAHACVRTSMHAIHSTCATPHACQALQALQARTLHRVCMTAPPWLLTFARLSGHPLAVAIPSRGVGRSAAPPPRRVRYRRLATRWSSARRWPLHRRGKFNMSMLPGDGGRLHAQSGSWDHMPGIMWSMQFQYACLFLCGTNLSAYVHH